MKKNNRSHKITKPSKKAKSISSINHAHEQKPMKNRTDEHTAPLNNALRDKFPDTSQYSQRTSLSSQTSRSPMISPHPHSPSSQQQQYPSSYPLSYPSPYPAHYPLPPPIPDHHEATVTKKMSEMPLLLIFLVCITVFWLPYLMSNVIGGVFVLINKQLAEVIIGVLLCIFTIGLMLFLRQYLDRPTLKDLGISNKNLGSNLILTAKLIFIINAVEYLLITIFQFIGISFEGGVTEVDILFIISAVIIAPIFEETVYRMNASTLLSKRLSIVWAAAITSTWFIAKHLPMWHFEHNFGLPSLFVILLIDIPLWWVITYYFLKRNCIWIPVLVHVFNNGAIVVYHYLPDLAGFALELIIVSLGVICIFLYGIPKVNDAIIQGFKSGKFRPTKRTYQYLSIAICLSVLFLITSEGLVWLANYDPIEGAQIGFILCGTIGFILFILSIFTVIYIYSNKNIVYQDT